ncbi:OLC1v1007688C1 [Oldenlandia corymbosa var. corymbosa]|uniref:Non-structural maintenance of chromosomes element 1 homolog n=1 Tax=Oldenlandia corymbosa var. corymbosa TaxID=529605 RepID=A0AAV1DKD1_OLDCO|nr:OLC1v1007688C1 [Oldenlandia corymbosa var. corymbosa]
MPPLQREEGGPASVLNWRHHALIQALLSRGPIKDNQFHSFFYQLTGKTPDHRSFNDYLLDINKQLAYVQLDLRKCLNQYDGKAYYGVANNFADDQSKLGTKYTVPQIALYKGIIEAIVQDSSGEGSISNTEALNVQLENQVSTGMGSQSQMQSPGNLTQVPTALKNFTMSQKDKTIEELIRDQWLCAISNGQRIGLGVRSFLDLRCWFHSNEVPTCEVCNEAAIKVELCQNEGCEVRMHPSCVKKKFSQTRAKKVCPRCGVQWHVAAVKREHLEEEDNNEDDAPENSSPPVDPSSRKRSRVSQQHQQNTQESKPISSASSNPVANTRRSTRSSARQHAA